MFGVARYINNSTKKYIRLNPKTGLKTFTVSFLICLVVVPFISQAQSDNESLSMSNIGSYVNFGISAGIGEGHINFVRPSLALRAGRFNVKGFVFNGMRGYQMQYELFRINPNDSLKAAFLTIGGGVTEKWITEKGFHYHQWRDVQSLGIGVSLYPNNRRSRFSANLSLSNFSIIRNHLYPLRRKESIFGQVSYTHYLFKFNDFAKEEHVTLFKLKQAKFQQNATVSFLSKWFNPYASFGLGLDRPIYTPVIGLKLGPVSSQFGFNIAQEHLPIGGSINVDLYSLTPSLKYDHVLGFGGNFYSEGYYDAYSGYEIDIIGTSISYNVYKRKGRHRFSFKLGLGQIRRSNSSFNDPDTPDSYNVTTSYIPNGGVSVNLFLFKMDESKLRKVWDKKVPKD